MQNSEFYSVVRDRKNVILMGDSLGDAGMADGVPHHAVLKIGFFNPVMYQKIHNEADMEARLQQYQQIFDVVLIGDETFNFIVELLSLLKN